MPPDAGFSRPPVFSVALILITLLIEAGFYALIPLSVGYFIDTAISSRSAAVVSTPLFLLLIGAAIAIGAGFGRDVFSARAQGGILRGMRLRFFEQLQRLPFRSHAPGIDAAARTRELVEELSKDFAAIGNAIELAVPWGILPLIEALLATGLIFWLNWRAGIMTFLLWPWVFLAPRTMARHVSRASEARDEEDRLVFGVFGENLSAQAVIRAFSLEQIGLTAFRKRNDMGLRTTVRAGFLSAFMERFTGAGVLGIQTLLLVLTVWLAFAGQMSIGAIAAVQMLAFVVSRSLLYLIEYLPALEAARGASRRIEQALAPRTVTDLPGARFLPPLETEIVLSHVDFQFDGQSGIETKALSDIRARIPRGSYVAFVGPAGSGKSTLIHLLMRLYDPTGGFIAIDGHDLKSVTQASLRSRMGVVLQENAVFHTSVRENIRLGKPDASEEAVAGAARTAGLDEFIRSLPAGYDTMLGDQGVRLASAEMQRLAIARAIVRNPDILLLDEVTSALDPVDELAVHHMLREVGKGRTVISASHRLSTVADADHIFVFDRGEIVEQGSHFELLAANGVYAGLWRKQAGFTFSADGRHVDVDARRLQAFPILETLEEDKLGELAPFFATETFPPGREIVRQNDPGDRFYIIARGVVDVWRTEEKSGNTKRVAVLQDGDFFGEITLITGFPRTATVRAQTVCTCISLERGQFNRLMEGFPELRQRLSAIAVERLRESSKAVTAALLV